ncbi:MAG: hypothetical protein PUJ51_05285 [Clostridiales bacterium]|nr:hypothetical protein [Terrisporobacter sp.]MDD5877643.1 hypothetical protein [Clostridiales bacterium]MDD7753903.1 hypothetical protein [Clostridiales bacterium]MDY4134758.1 hypothetical protein [Terrisporobacter sp.]MDY4736271.1 hypothetical protein [Terrisporobacter sp.]
MKSTLCFCMKDISFSGFGELIIWIGTGVLIVAAILALIKKPKI